MERNAMRACLTADQIMLLKKSFRQLDTDRVAEQFYKKLFELHPAVKPMFPTDTSELKDKLMSVFELVIYSFEEKNHNEFRLQKPVVVPLRELGRKHDEKGVKPEHYAIANDLLLQVMHQESERVFTSEVRRCWSLALNHLTDAMLDSSHRPSTKSRFLGNTIRETYLHIISRIRKSRDS